MWMPSNNTVVFHVCRSSIPMMMMMMMYVYASIFFSHWPSSGSDGRGDDQYVWKTFAVGGNEDEREWMRHFPLQPEHGCCRRRLFLSFFPWWNAALCPIHCIPSPIDSLFSRPNRVYTSWNIYLNHDDCSRCCWTSVWVTHCRASI